MTANEMFQELGYGKTADSKNQITYKQTHGLHNFRIDIYKKEKAVKFTFDWLDVVVADFEEILAVAKLIEEMEEHEQASIIE